MNAWVSAEGAGAGQAGGRACVQRAGGCRRTHISCAAGRSVIGGGGGGEGGRA